MKTLLVTLNAKYIHKALALRLLYVASKPQHDVCICEYTIKDSVASITADLLAKKADVIAFSCYIWNIEMTKAICAALKKQAPSLILILGGPEVSYEPAYFLAHTCADYIMSGEGEITFPQLLSCIE
ncbi:cobalamin-dependent protein, partial [Massilicoli timonensis]